MIAIEKFLRPTQSELFAILSQRYYGQCVISNGNYILVHGESPVMLIAHLDTVHKVPIKTIYRLAGGTILTSPQGIGGDDRCGVYALVNVYEQSKAKPWMLFTCDEEIGGVGAEVFCWDYAKNKLSTRLNDLKCLVEIDRKGRNDAVYYDCENRAFEAYITGKGFRTAYGSFSDISLIAPTLGIAAVNLSSGYYNPHTRREYIVRSEIDNTVSKVVEIVADAVSEDFPRYEYYADDYFQHEDIPPEYREMYDALLDEYTAGELDYYREVYGNRVLEELYRELCGSFFVDLEGCEIDDSDE